METAETILEAAKMLPQHQRLHLVEALIQTLEPSPQESDDELRALWRDEIRRRSEEVRDGSINVASWEQVQLDSEGLFSDGD